MTVPSKQLSIGDANGEHLVDVPSTKCRVQISAIPWGNATAIDVWVTVVD